MNPPLFTHLDHATHRGIDGAMPSTFPGAGAVNLAPHRRPLKSRALSPRKRGAAPVVFSDRSLRDCSGILIFEEKTGL